MRYFVVPSGEEGKTCCHQRGCEALSRFSQSSKGNVNCKSGQFIHYTSVEKMIASCTHKHFPVFFKAFEHRSILGAALKVTLKCGLEL